MFDDDENLWKKQNQIWIPKEDLELKLKIIVCSHCGTIGHRGMEATKSIILEKFWWETISKDVEELVRGCFHCIATRSGEIIPRPLGHAIHGEYPNEVIHMDFLYMGPGVDGKKYVLIIRDDLSGYIWLWPTEEANAEAAAEALCVWVGSFGSMKWLVSDQGSHFKNKLLKEMIDELRTQHHFTTAYSPWANGSVERICREVLRACRALIGEWRLSPRDWPAVTESVQSVINQTPLRKLGRRDAEIPGVYRSPLEVFTGHRPVRPLLRALPVGKYRMARTTDEIHARVLLNIDQIQDALSQMHREANDISTAARKRQVERHNRRTNVHNINFSKGDFVLVRHTQPGGHKLSFLWRGPRRITDARSDWVYEVQNLITRKREVVHARRMHLYRPDMDGRNVSPALLKLAEHSEACYQIAEDIRGIREVGGELQVCVEWAGLPDRSDWTWEPLTQVFEDMPGRLQDFLHTAGDRALKQFALAQCDLK